jgi:uncharacterized Tic20 family protein
MTAPNDSTDPNTAPQEVPAALPVAASGPSAVSADERQWAMLAHLSALIGYLVTSGWAGSVGGFLGPLIVWQMKKDTIPFVDQQGKEALNFSITICIAFAILFTFGMVFGIVTLGLGFFLVIPALVAVALYALIFTIIASIKANDGIAYRYPIALRLIK